MRRVSLLPCLLALAVLGGGPAAGSPGDGASGTTAAETQPSPAPIVRLVPPLEQDGRTRVHALVTDVSVDRVRFFLGTEEVGADGTRPFQVRVDLDARRDRHPDPGGPAPAPGASTLRAVAYDADGRILGEDQILLAPRPHTAGLTIREISADPSGDGVRVELDLALAPEQSLEHVDIYRNRELHARLQEPPFRVHLPVPDPAPEDYVRAVAVLAGGGTLEDARPLSPSGMGERLDVALVELVVMVSDRGGDPVRGLGPERFRVRLDSRELPVQRFREAREVPLSLGLLVDSSTSMAPVMDATRRAAGQFLERTLRPGDQALLVDVSTLPRVAYGLTGEPARLEAAFAALEVGGDTALFDALVLATVELGNVPGRRALVALTDGRDFGSYWGLGKCARVVHRAGAPVYVVSVGGMDRYRSRPDRNLRLAAFARDTGGRLFRVTSPRDLDRVYDQIEGELRSQYLLSVATDRVLSHEELKRLDVQVDGRGLDARVATRRTRDP